jgi:acyl-CoA thioesterase-2
MPSVPGPDGLPSETDLARKVKDHIPENVRDKFTADQPIEIRVIDPINYLKPHRRPAQQYAWMRAAGSLPDDYKIHSALLAYASDFGLSSTSLLPHGATFMDPNMQVASLDHAMWFHRSFRLDDWVLYSRDSPAAAGGRGFNRGQIFTKDGTLIASTAQESLIRSLPAKTDEPE